jgi:hypothetical protein
MLFRELMTVYSFNRAEHTSTVWAKYRILLIKESDTYSYLVR